MSLTNRAESDNEANRRAVSPSAGRDADDERNRVTSDRGPTARFRAGASPEKPSMSCRRNDDDVCDAERTVRNIRRRLSEQLNLDWEDGTECEGIGSAACCPEDGPERDRSCRTEEDGCEGEKTRDDCAGEEKPQEKCLDPVDAIVEEGLRYGRNRGDRGQWRSTANSCDGGYERDYFDDAADYRNWQEHRERQKRSQPRGPCETKRSRKSALGFEPYVDDENDRTDGGCCRGDDDGTDLPLPGSGQENEEPRRDIEIRQLREELCRVDRRGLQLLRCLKTHRKRLLMECRRFGSSPLADSDSTPPSAAQNQQDQLLAVKEREKQQMAEVRQRVEVRLKEELEKSRGKCCVVAREAPQNDETPAEQRPRAPRSEETPQRSPPRDQCCERPPQQSGDQCCERPPQQSRDQCCERPPQQPRDQCCERPQRDSCNAAEKTPQCCPDEDRPSSDSDCDSIDGSDEELESSKCPTPYPTPSPTPCPKPCPTPCPTPQPTPCPAQQPTPCPTQPPPACPSPRPIPACSTPQRPRRKIPYQPPSPDSDSDSVDDEECEPAACPSQQPKSCLTQRQPPCPTPCGTEQRPTQQQQRRRVTYQPPSPLSDCDSVDGSDEEAARCSNPSSGACVYTGQETPKRRRRNLGNRPSSALFDSAASEDDECDHRGSQSGARSRSAISLTAGGSDDRLACPCTRKSPSPTPKCGQPQCESSTPKCGQPKCGESTPKCGQPKCGESTPKCGQPKCGESTPKCGQSKCESSEPKRRVSDNCNAASGSCTPPKPKNLDCICGGGR